MFNLLMISCAMIACAHANSAGAPAETCDDMTPKHPVDPQKSPLPYKVTVSRDSVAPAGDVDITIGGDKNFKGYLLQVRSGNTAVGQFQIAGGDKYSKTLNCHGNNGSAATHKNATDKKNLKVTWRAPKVAGKYTVYATVAQDGGIFWAYKPVSVINVS